MIGVAEIVLESDTGVVVIATSIVPGAKLGPVRCGVRHLFQTTCQRALPALIENTLWKQHAFHLATPTNTALAKPNVPTVKPLSLLPLLTSLRHL